MFTLFIIFLALIVGITIGVVGTPAVKIFIATAKNDLYTQERALRFAAMKEIAQADADAKAAKVYWEAKLATAEAAVTALRDKLTAYVLSMPAPTAAPVVEAVPVELLPTLPGVPLQPLVP